MCRKDGKRWAAVKVTATQEVFPPFFQAKILCATDSATSFVKTGKQEQMKVGRIIKAGTTEMTVQTSAHIYRSNAVMLAASIMNFLHFSLIFYISLCIAYWRHIIRCANSKVKWVRWTWFPCLFFLQFFYNSYNNIRVPIRFRTDLALAGEYKLECGILRIYARNRDTDTVLQCRLINR